MVAVAVTIAAAVAVAASATRDVRGTSLARYDVNENRIRWWVLC